MKLNENTKIIGKKVILVPYEAKHVNKYHQWMQSTELQQLTASEPLTLEQEYDMQRSWREDENKCTFLILDRSLCDDVSEETGELEALVGDTNLFLHDCDYKTETADKQLKQQLVVAEAEIMIAEKQARGKGYGWEAMLLMFQYALKKMQGVTKFEAKIGMENAASLHMFERMKFRECGRSIVFQEITLERPVTEEWRQWLDEQVQLQLEVYDEQRYEQIEKNKFK